MKILVTITAIIENYLWGKINKENPVFYGIFIFPKMCSIMLNEFNYTSLNLNSLTNYVFNYLCSINLI